MKKFIVITIIILIILFILFGQKQSEAGSSQQYRWEGVIIGLGAAILGGAVISQHNSYYRNRHRPYPRNHYQPPSHHPPQHECIVPFWVPARYRYTWVDGRYDHHGNWKPGRWAKWTVRPGYWQERNICR